MAVTGARVPDSRAAAWARSIRRAVAYSASADLADALANEAELMALTGGSSDHRAAVDAFLAKEKPTYTGA